MESSARSLPPEKVEELCETAEETARNYIMSKVSWREVTELNIAVEAGGEESLTIDIDVEVRLSPLLRDVDIEKMTKEAVDAAFRSVEEFLRKVGCRSRE